MKHCVTLAAALLLTAVALPGCATHGGGELAIRSQRDNAILRGGFENGIYKLDADRRVTMVLFDGPRDAPTQVATIRLFWEPRAGRTPIASTSTNATIHYVIFVGDDRQEVGIYNGAGFVFPSTAPGKSSLSASVWESTLTLALPDHTEGFADRLGAASLEGSFTVVRDHEAVDDMLRSINIALRDRLGYPRMVKQPGPSDHATHEPTS